MSKERLDKLIASQSKATRSDVKKLIKSGRVCVNSVVVKDFGMHIDCDNDIVSVDGKNLNYRKYIYLMMNKPAGVVSASRDPKVQTVVDLVPDEYKRDGLFPAGRLDKDTTGFVLITNDGNLAHNILSPKNHVYKEYHATLDEAIGEQEIRLFKEGIVLEDLTECRPAKLEMLENVEGNVAKITICEGKFHQVKRMFSSVGREVLALDRVSIAGIPLDRKLAHGECRQFTESEILSIITK